MTQTLLILQGMLVGAIVAAPYGPLALVAVQQAYKNGYWTGLSIGLGACLADAVFGASLAFSSVWLNTLLETYRFEAQMLSALILFGMGVVLWRTAHTSHKKSKAVARNRLSDNLSRLMGGTGMGFGVTIAHPGNLAGMAVAFGAAGLLGEPLDVASALIVTGAIFAGALLSWMVLLWLLLKQTGKIESWLPKNIRNKAQPAVALLLMVIGGGIAVHGVYQLLLGA